MLHEKNFQCFPCKTLPMFRTDERGDGGGGGGEGEGGLGLSAPPFISAVGNNH